MVEKNFKLLEVDIWTDKVERFRNEFQSYNDVKYEGSEVIATQGCDKRYSIMYRIFGDKEPEFPEQGYYQLKNCWIIEAE